MIWSDDAGEEVLKEDKFKYIYDLATLEEIDIRNQLTDYDCWQHVPSDIPTNERFLAPNTFKSQNIIDDIVQWTSVNKMKLNEEKSMYMIFSKLKENFSTRLTMH